MKISNAVKHIGTSITLKRIASAYVIDYRNLSDEEIRAALLKTAPQYYYKENVKKAVTDIFLNETRKHRVLSKLIIKEVLLNRDDFSSSEKETSDDVIFYEQSIIDRANEDMLSKGTKRTEQLELYQFVLETAWENNADISVDENALIEKLRVRMLITERESRTIEAHIDKFPNPGNELNSRGDIEEARRLLQSKGLLFSIRNEDGVDFDLIPDEIATALRIELGVYIKDHGYRELVAYKAIRLKSYLSDTLRKCCIEAEGNLTLTDLQEIVLEQVSPYILLGGLTSRDGLEVDDLKKWCSEIGQTVSGTKAELIERLVGFYDNLILKTVTIGDSRQIWYEHFEQFASRDLTFLRSQQLIDKDLDCESRFEEATDFLFEKKFNHKPLKQIGSAHADGIISYRDKIILWDNKSKASPVHLKDHIKQFEGYIRESERSVAGFWVIGPDFTAESQSMAMQFTVDFGVTMTLIKAVDLRGIADDWYKKNGAKAEDPFPLGYLIQPGLLNRTLVPDS